MSQGQLSSVLEHLRRVVGPAEATASDRQLLAEFVASKSESAFAALVHRHGSLVWNVCRRVLTNAASAEDAFQATFLVLVRKAAVIRRPERLGPWLYGVARRTALKARTMKRLEPEPLIDLPALVASEVDAWQEVRPVLDEEIGWLPEKYRLPLVMCYLEGRTNEQAAAALGWTRGTLSGRLARARKLLRRRLLRRGVTLSVGMLAGLLAQNSLAAATPTALLHSTIRAGVLAAAGASAAGFVSTTATTLAQGTLRTMFMTKLKLAIVCCGALMLTLGVGALVAHRAAAGATDDTATKPSIGGVLPDRTAEARMMARDVLAQAVATARQIPDAYERCLALSGIAETQISVGEKPAARKTLEYALASARELKHASKGIDIGSVAVLQFRAGDAAAATANIRLALEVTEKVKNVELRANYLPYVAEMQAKMGDAEGARNSFKKAVEVARSLENVRRRADALTTTAGFQARAGDFAGAMAVADSFKDQDPGEGIMSKRGHILLCIAWRRAERGQSKEALDAVDLIADPTTKAHAFEHVAEELAKCGEYKQAEDIAQSIDHELYRARAFAAIAGAQSARGQHAAAAETAAKARGTKPLEEGRQGDEAFVSSSNDPNSLAIQARAGQSAAALKSARAIDDAGRRAVTLADIAIAQAETKDVARAKATIREALDAIQSISLPDNEPDLSTDEGRKQMEQRDSVVLARERLIDAMARAGDPRGAHELIALLPDEHRQGLAAHRASRIQAEYGGAADAITWTRGLKSLPTRIEALRGVAEGLLAKPVMPK
jgi:RNA polymerase sigma factor (sigma-70 family)